MTPRTYDDWKTADPEYWDYDDYDPRDDPVVQLEMLLEGIRKDLLTLQSITAKDRMMVYGSLPAIHEIYTMTALIADQFPNMLPKSAD